MARSARLRAIASGTLPMQRKLTAILSADVVGYSGLMEADETGTLERLKANRAAIFDPKVAAHGGRVFKLLGDGALVEFPSVVAAVNCALAIQEATAQAEPQLAAEKRIRYRIGVNLGDIIIDEDDIYGEGVNVAARLQVLAPVGGVAVSGVVRDQVEGKSPCEFDDMGEHTVKNIERPVHVFAVRPLESDEPEAMTEARKLSICVLPFANMSDDPQQEYFSDGISEDIITDLSKVSSLFVVSRHSAFTFKGKSVDVPKVARELKVSHVLEGSVRKAAGRVRITAQLIDGVSNGHVWAERYDRDLSDIFALQDEISEAIVKALKLKLLPEEKKAIEQRGTNSLEAYNLYLMARRIWATGNIGNARRGDSIVRLMQRAIEIDPNYAHAWALIARAQSSLHFHLGRSGDGGLAAAERAIALDNNLAEAHAARAGALQRQRQLGEAGREIEIALRLDPQSPDVLQIAGQYYFQTRRFDKAIACWEQAAASLDNDYSSLGMLVGTYLAVGDKEGALSAARRTLARTDPILASEPDNGSAMSFAFNALALLGERDRAKELAERALVLDPDNVNMRYNFACVFVRDLDEIDTALNLLETAFQMARQSAVIDWAKVDVDLDPVREHPRFKAMIAAAEARLADKPQE